MTYAMAMGEESLREKQKEAITYVFDRLRQNERSSIVLRRTYKKGYIRGRTFVHVHLAVFTFNKIHCMTTLPTYDTHARDS